MNAENMKIISNLLKAVELHINEEDMSKRYIDAFMEISSVEDNYLAGNDINDEAYDILSEFITVIEEEISKIPQPLSDAIKEVDIILSNHYFKKVKMYQYNILGFNKAYKKM